MSEEQIRYNTALEEQTNSARVGRIRELTATLDCLQTISRNYAYTYMDYQPLKQVADRLLKELFP